MLLLPLSRLSRLGLQRLPGAVLRTGAAGLDRPPGPRASRRCRRCTRRRLVLHGLAGPACRRRAVALVRRDGVGDAWVCAARWRPVVKRLLLQWLLWARPCVCGAATGVRAQREVGHGELSSTPPPSGRCASSRRADGRAALPWMAKGDCSTLATNQQCAACARPRRRRTAPPARAGQIARRHQPVCRWPLAGGRERTGQRCLLDGHAQRQPVATIQARARTPSMRCSRRTAAGST